jgi:cobalt-zinc-cadmium efflux system protein
MRKHAYVTSVGHDHAHASAATSASGKHLRALGLAFAIGLVFMLAEFIVAAATSSLALLSDAVHTFTDVIALAMALGAVLLAKRSPPTHTRTFGYYRAEVFAALINSLLLFVVAGYVIFEAVDRFSDPPEVPGWPVLIIGVAGLVANIVAFLLLRSGAQESINVQGAYLEVLADLVGSVGVLLSAVIILTTGWAYADPIMGVAIGVWVLPRAYGLARRSLRILFQHSPEALDVEEVTRRLEALAGVADVHDLHVWTLTSGMEVASAHLTVRPGVRQEEVLRSAQEVLAHEFEITHATLQVEGPDSAERCSELSW